MAGEEVACQTAQATARPARLAGAVRHGPPGRGVGAAGGRGHHPADRRQPGGRLPRHPYGAFGNINNLSETVVKAAPLVLAGAGLAVAYRANMWNIGAEGQIFVGGLAAIRVRLYLGTCRPSIVLPLAALAGSPAARWAGIAGILKVRLGIDEVINTIMLKYIARSVSPG